MTATRASRDIADAAEALSLTSRMVTPPRPETAPDHRGRTHVLPPVCHARAEALLTPTRDIPNASTSHLALGLRIQTSVRICQAIRLRVSLA